MTEQGRKKIINRAIKFITDTAPTANRRMASAIIEELKLLKSDTAPLRERYVVVADRGSRLPCLYCCFYVARTEDCSMPPEIADVLPNCVRDNVHFKEAKS